jgi:hypothetical protein
LQAFKRRVVFEITKQKKKSTIAINQSITSRVDSGEDPLIEGTGSDVPDLVRVREQTLAYELGSTR